MTSGVEELSGPSEKLLQTDRALDEFEHSLGLPQAPPEWLETEAQKIFSFHPDLVKKMSARELGEAAFSLLRFAQWVQTALNREQARVRWAEEAINLTIRDSVNKQRGLTLDERRWAAIGQSSQAKECEAIRVKAQLRVDRLIYRANHIQAVARSLQNLKDERDE